MQIDNKTPPPDYSNLLSTELDCFVNVKGVFIKLKRDGHLPSIEQIFTKVITNEINFVIQGFLISYGTLIKL